VLGFTTVFIADTGGNLKALAIALVTLTAAACGASAEAPASTPAANKSPAAEFCQAESQRLPVEWTDQTESVKFMYSKIECQGAVARQVIYGEAIGQTIDVLALTTEAKDSMLESCRIDDVRPYLDKGMKLQPQYIVKLPNGVYVNYVLELSNCGSF